MLAGERSRCRSYSGEMESPERLEFVNLFRVILFVLFGVLNLYSCVITRKRNAINVDRRSDQENKLG
ncbi:hypothetical protein HanXRQr2_Chr06g0278391 [Helianthus annuus]|uniref:Uncharacterized protein n=1 Tax=Helianthus annuus TaxID=4232 RepID=A0A251TNU0_HELAN|nr:hypothetical protein HanXRQr2_Chr06g0278391 [Helianthus annuus]